MNDSIKIAKEVIQTEIDGLNNMANNIGGEFDEAVKAIISSKGRTIICGMGKSGLIGKKIAASFVSTGTPSFFMHPGEAFHGDLGMVKREDIFIAISNSGETDEVIKLLPFLRDNENYIIAMTGKPHSTLAINAHCHLNIAVPKEACRLQLAPTSSTTAALVMGDALTVALMEMGGFKPESFAKFHPGGSLGKKLLSRVRDEMVTMNLPISKADDNFVDIVQTITLGQLGLTLVDFSNEKYAIITDGDLRRAMDKYQEGIFKLQARDIAIVKPLAISADCKIQSAYEKMESEGVTSLVVYQKNKIIGILKK